MDTALRMRLAVPTALAALAMIGAGCSASDEPADPTSTTPPAAAAQRTTPAAPTGTAEPSGTGTSAAETSGAPASGQVISVTVAGGRVTPTPATIDVKLGDSITIEVSADISDDVHVHGYEKLLPLEPGRPARLPLAAVIPGQFDVELEGAKLLLFTISVS